MQLVNAGSQHGGIHPMHINAPEFAAAVVDRYLALASPKGQPQ